MVGNEGISVADALALRNTGNDDGWGGNGSWWIIIFILFAAFGGWGGNGFGGGGNDRGYNACCTPATMAGMTDAFNFNQLDNGVRGLERGLCDGFYAMNNAVAAVGTAVQNCCSNLQQTMCQGFNGINTAIMQDGYQTQAGFNALGAQLASCCCDIGRGQDAIACQISNNARDKIGRAHV